MYITIHYLFFGCGGIVSKGISSYQLQIRCNNHGHFGLMGIYEYGICAETLDLPNQPTNQHSFNIT